MVAISFQVVRNGSASDNFSVSGSDMDAGITVTAPTGYEVSTDNSSFSSSSLWLRRIYWFNYYICEVDEFCVRITFWKRCLFLNSATSQNVAASGSVNSLPSGFSASSSASGVCSGSTVDLSTSTRLRLLQRHLVMPLQHWIPTFQM